MAVLDEALLDLAVLDSAVRKVAVLEIAAAILHGLAGHARRAGTGTSRGEAS